MEVMFPATFTSDKFIVICHQFENWFLNQHLRQIRKKGKKKNLPDFANIYVNTEGSVPLIPYKETICLSNLRNRGCQEIL